MVPAFLSIPLGYLIGSLNAASIVAWFWARVDMRKEPDGRVSASEVHHKLGLLPFLLVVLFDALFAMSAVLLAGFLSEGHRVIMMLAGLAAMCGHNWSIFIKFKGGLGATAMLGILIVMVTWQFFIGVAIAIALYITTRKSSMATVFAITTMSIALLVTEGVGMVAFYPFMLLSIMSIKRYQVKRLTETAH